MVLTVIFNLSWLIIICLRFKDIKYFSLAQRLIKKQTVVGCIRIGGCQYLLELTLATITAAGPLGYVSIIVAHLDADILAQVKVGLNIYAKHFKTHKCKYDEM